MLAYLERKRFEARVLWSVLGEALQKKEQGQEMSFNSLSAMGFEIKGG